LDPAQKLLPLPTPCHAADSPLCVFPPLGYPPPPFIPHVSQSGAAFPLFPLFAFIVSLLEASLSLICLLSWFPIPLAVSICPHEKGCLLPASFSHPYISLSVHEFVFSCAIHRDALVYPLFSTSFSRLWLYVFPVILPSRNASSYLDFSPHPQSIAFVCFPRLFVLAVSFFRFAFLFFACTFPSLHFSRHIVF